MGDTNFIIPGYTHPDVNGSNANGYVFHYHTEEHTLAFSADAGDLVKVPGATIRASVVLPLDLRELDWGTRKTLTAMVDAEIKRDSPAFDWEGFRLHHILRTSAPF